jgi:hypothetical protein
MVFRSSFDEEVITSIEVNEEVSLDLAVESYFYNEPFRRCFRDVEKTLRIA